MCDMFLPRALVLINEYNKQLDRLMGNLMLTAFQNKIESTKLDNTGYKNEATN